MGNIHEQRYAEVPFACAREYLDNYIRDVETHGAGRILLSVKVPLERLGFNRRVEASKAVAVSFVQLTDDNQSKRQRGISWKPLEGGPFPEFHGWIGVEASPQDDSCLVTLEGDYDPPFGVLGDAFDAVVGKHISRLTARNLLDEIAIMMESAYGEEGH